MSFSSRPGSAQPTGNRTWGTSWRLLQLPCRSALCQHIQGCEKIERHALLVQSCPQLCCRTCCKMKLAYFSSAISLQKGLRCDSCSLTLPARQANAFRQALCWLLRHD